MTREPESATAEEHCQSAAERRIVQREARAALPEAGRNLLATFPAARRPPVRVVEAAVRAHT